MPSVSVVIPTKGRPDLLTKAVRSALQQTLSDIEVIVVIDGADPATEMALQDMGDPRIRIVPLSKSVGGSETRNTGARLARSEWIALLDDDDEWLPHKLERQMARIRPGYLQIVVSRYLLRTGNSPDVALPVRLPRPQEPLSEYMFCTVRNLFQTSTVICSRELLLNVPFTVGLRRLQDWDWLLRAVQNSDVELVVVPEILSIYHVGGPGMTISKKCDWKYSLDWAQANRALMTQKAYSGFVVKKCVPDAAQQRAAIGDIRKLFKEAMQGQGLNLRLALMFVMYYALSIERRMALAALIQRWYHGQSISRTQTLN